MIIFSALAILASSHFCESRPNHEVFIRADKGLPIEKLANSIRSIGRLESRVKGTRVFLVDIRSEIDEDSARKQLGSLSGIHALDPDDEPFDMNSLRSLDRKIGHLQGEGDEKSDGKGDSRLEKEKGDYLKAYRYFVGQRAFPKDKFDWKSLNKGRDHTQQMNTTRLGDRTGFSAPAQWTFVGPTNLAVPYNPYYGVSPINGRVNAVAYDPNNSQTIYAGGAQGGLWKSSNGGVTWNWLSASWTELGVNCIRIDPNNSETIYVGRGDYHGYIAGSYGIMKSTDGGNTWNEIFTSSVGQIGVASILIDPTNSQTILAGTGDVNTFGDLYRSTDGGQTWHGTSLSDTDFLWPTLAASVPNSGAVRFYAVAGGVATSTNAASRIFSSDDHGQTWQQLASPIYPDGNLHYAYCVATSPTNSNNVYVLDSENQTFLTSTDQGATWTDQSANLPTGGDTDYNFSQSFYDYHLECGSQGSGASATDLIYLGEIDITESSDGGNTWNSIGGPTYSLDNNAVTHNDQHCLAVCPTNPNQALFCNDGGVYSLSYNSSTGLNTVTPLNKLLGNSMFYKVAFHPTNPNIMLGGTQDNATPVSTGNLSNWLNVAGGDGGGCAVNQMNPLIQYATIDGFVIYHTSDGWNTETDITNGEGSGANVPFVTALTLDPQNQYLMYAATNYLYQWDENAQQWNNTLGGQDLTNEEINNAVVTTIAIAPTDGQRIYTGSNDGALYMSTDRGITWTELSSIATNLPTAAITSISVSPTNENDILVGYSTSGQGVTHIFRCTNTLTATPSFSSVAGNGGSALPDVSLNAIARDLDNPASTWYVGTDVGVLQTSNSGQTWTNAGAPLGLPNVIVDDLAAVSGTRYLNAGTYGRGIWRLSIPSQALVSTLTNLMISPNTISAGSQATGTVTLSSAAPAGGLIVSLASASPSVVTVPSTVTVAAGATTASFSISSESNIPATTSATITATLGSVTFPQTINVDVLALSGLSLSPSTVGGGASSTGTVTLSVVSPAGGTIVNLASDHSVATVPASVTVPSGQTTATFQVGTSVVTAPVTANIIASLGAAAQSAQLTITPAGLASIGVSPTNVVGGVSSTGTVTLTGIAPAGGIVVSLSSNSSSATVPSSVTVAAGSSSATFTVSTSATSATTAAAIQATYSGTTLSTNLNIGPASLTGLALTPTAVFAGGSSTATVTLNGPAGPGGAVVSLSATYSSVKVPASVTVSPGSSSASFTVNTTTVTQTISAAISATFNGVGQSATLTVNPVAVIGLSVSPSTVIGGTSTTGTLTLNAPAPTNGITAVLYSSLSVATAPSSVTVPAGSTSANFTIQTSIAYSTESVTITAVQAGKNFTANLTLQTPLLASVAVSSTSVVAGNSIAGTVSLVRTAPSGGVTIALTCSTGATAPTSVFIPSGATSATFTVTTVGEVFPAQASVSASLGGVTKSATFTIAPASLASFTISPTSVRDRTSATGAISLNGVAPSGGLAVTVSSNSPYAKPVSMVTIPAGASSATFTITTLPVIKNTLATLSASESATRLTATLEVVPSAVTAITLSTNSVVGGSKSTAIGTVTLSGPAVAGLTVDLTSSNKKIGTVPSTIAFKTGATTATFAVNHLLVSAAADLTISAMSGGVSQSTSLSVTPFVLTSLALSATDVVGGTGTTGLVTLNAEPGTNSHAIVVKLSSSTKSVGIPASVTVAIGKQGASFAVTTSAVASPVTAVIGGTLGTSSQAVSLALTPPSLLSVSVSPVTVRGGLTTVVTGTVKLTGPAPTGGIIVSLASSDPIAASVPLSVTIAAGKTSATFTVKHSKVASSTQVTITASVGSIHTVAGLTVNP